MASGRIMLAPGRLCPPSSIFRRPRQCQSTAFGRTSSHRQLQRRTFLSRPARDGQPRLYEQLDTMKIRRIRSESVSDSKSRIKMAAMGLAITVLLTYITTRMVPITNTSKPAKMDAGERQGTFPESHTIVIKGQEVHEPARDLVKTGTSTVPYFPRVLDFRDREAAGDKAEQYQLLGLGIRTVSFLGIQVYVVGMYVAVEDIAALQSAMVKRINSVASTLVAGEKDQLTADLLDPSKSEEIWDALLKDDRIRTIVRIVPTRNTDFNHLRDAFVRHITARAQGPNKAEYQDDAFGMAVAEFKQLFSRGSIPKGKELLMARDAKGRLIVWYDDGKNGSQRLGEVVDERISRSVWLNYLAGKSVASESARKKIIEGVVECVERPIGTVATQVV